MGFACALFAIQSTQVSDYKREYDAMYTDCTGLYNTCSANSNHCHACHKHSHFGKHECVACRLHCGDNHSFSILTCPQPIVSFTADFMMPKMCCGGSASQSCQFFCLKIYFTSLRWDSRTSLKNREHLCSICAHLCMCI